MGALALLAGTLGILWGAHLAQLAGDTAEPQLVAAQTLIVGVVAAGLWAAGLWALHAAAPSGRAARWATAALCVTPWLVLLVSSVDVLREVCARPGGLCG